MAKGGFRGIPGGMNQMQMMKQAQKIVKKIQKKIQKILK